MALKCENKDIGNLKIGYGNEKLVTEKSPTF